MHHGLIEVVDSEKYIARLFSARADSLEELGELIAAHLASGDLLTSGDVNLSSLIESNKKSAYGECRVLVRFNFFFLDAVYDFCLPKSIRDVKIMSIDQISSEGTKIMKGESDRNKEIAKYTNPCGSC